MSNQGLTPPQQVRIGGIIGIVQSIIGLAYALFLAVRDLTGERDSSLVYETADANTHVGLGTAIFFIIIFGATLAGGILMIRGAKWGRGPTIMLQMILLLNCWFMIQAGQWFLAAAVGLSCIIGLAMLFSGPAVAWAANRYGS